MGTLVEPPDHAIWLDDAHCYTTFTLSGEGPDAEPAGAIFYHRRIEGDWCAGSIRWRPAPGDQGPVWTLNRLDPLDVEPSVKCTSCPDDGLSHGFIRQGTWVPAGALPAVDW